MDIRALIPPAFLLMVAAFHGYNVVHNKLSPWKGGGFGMFSTIDSPGERIARLTLHFEEGEISIPAPAEIGDVRMLRTFPRDRFLRAYLETASHLLWLPRASREGAKAAVASPVNSFAVPKAVLAPRSFSIEVLTPSFDSRSHQMTYARVAVVKLPAREIADVERDLGAPPGYVEFIHRP